ncbi:MAG: 4Fe-4S binding protein [Candidatus Bathyarchaeia archaeon]|jgi:ferredoxin
MPEKNASAIDIFGMLSEDSSAEAKKKQSQELLKPTVVKKFFKEGSIKINKFTCAGVQCKLCVNACPTNALYWKTGEIGIIEDLCVYCGACVFNCMVDDCIKIERTREDGKVERFSKPNDVVTIDEKIGGKKRFDRVKSIFPTISKYCESYCNTPKDEHTFFGYVNKNNGKQMQKRKKLRRHNRGNR